MAPIITMVGVIFVLFKSCQFFFMDIKMLLPIVNFAIYSGGVFLLT